MKKYLILTFIIVIFFVIPIHATEYDLIIKGGNIYDPLSDQLLEKFNIGILGDKIDIITKSNLNGAIEIDASGKLITPGFIDSFQRHFGEPFETLRMQDGVTSSVYVSDQPFESFLINDKNKISLINRVMIYDLSKLKNKLSEKDTADYINKKLEDGYMGLYLKVTPNEYIDLSKINEKVPLYLDFIDFKQEEIIPWLNDFIKKREPSRNLHIIGGNFYFNTLDNLLGFSESVENISIGGFPFSYVNMKPNQISPSVFDSAKGKYYINQKDNTKGVMDDNLKNSDNTLGVLNLISQDTIKNILNSRHFTTESFSYYPASKLSTGDINAFMGRFLLANNMDNLYQNIYMQSAKVRDIFGKNHSPFATKASIENGFDADLLIINMEKVSPHSSMTDAIHPSSGIEYVIRGGNVILENGVKSLSAPKAMYLTDSNLPFELMEKFNIKMKSKSREHLDALIYKSKQYLPLEKIFSYLDIKYQQDLGKLYIGSILKFELGSDYYSVGANNMKLEDGIILINGSYYISTTDFKSAFKDYFNISVSETGINLKPTGMTKLLDKIDNKKFNLNVRLSYKDVVLSYAISILLIVSFFILLNKERRGLK